MALQRWAGQIISFATFAMLARWLEPKDFGVVAVATLVIQFAQVFLNIGWAEAIVQVEELEDEVINAVFWLSTLVGGAAAAIIWVLAPTIAELLGQAESMMYIRALAPVFLVNSQAAVLQALLRRGLRFKYLAARDLAVQGSSSVAALSAVLMGAGAWALVIQQLMAAFIGLGVFWGVTGFRPSRPRYLVKVVPLAKFGWHVLTFNVYKFLNFRGAQLVMATYLTPHDMGLLAVALQIVTNVVNLVTDVINQAAFPVLARFQRDLAGMAILSERLLALVINLSVPLFLAIALGSSLVCSLVLGQEWIPAAELVRVLALFGIAQSIITLNSSLLLACGKARWRSHLMGLSSGLNFGLLVAFAPLGVVVATVIHTIRGYVFVPIYWLCGARLAPVRAIRVVKLIRPTLWAALPLLVVYAADSLRFPGGYTDTLGSLIRVIVVAFLFLLTHMIFSPKFRQLLFSIGRSPRQAVAALRQGLVGYLNS